MKQRSKRKNLMKQISNIIFIIQLLIYFLLLINQLSLKYFNILFFLFHLYSVDFFTFKFFINCLHTTILLSYTYN